MSRFGFQEQVQNELRNSSYGIKFEDLVQMAESFEKTKFTYWRAEERRRVSQISCEQNIKQLLDEVK